jgi:DNA replication and repair protein RecF
VELTRVRIDGLRRLEGVDWRPRPGLNVVTGDNGAGKTSLLEAVHLMAYGRSFRGRVRDGLVGRAREGLEVFIEWTESPTAPRTTHRAGLRHTGQSWEGRLDGRDVESLGELCSALSVVTFEPGSHVLVSGGGEARRRQLDWGLFHVEPGFLALWRRYARALKQRNSVLKAGRRDGQLEAWDHELAQAGAPLAAARAGYLEALAPHLEALVGELLPEAGTVGLEAISGWRDADMPLEDALLLARDRDLASGHSTIGPHRGDWRIHYGNLPGRDMLSRGQAKLTALAFLLAQARHQADRRGAWPVVALDDLASELDRTHQGHVLDMLDRSGAQVLVTGTEPPAPLRGTDRQVSWFHVEQGRLEGPSTNAPTLSGDDG